MDTNLEQVTDWLVVASAQIEAPYFHLPISGDQEQKYRERVYCYELYHYWRCQWPRDFLFSLNGEVDKSGHPLIPGNWKPDFLVHMPGQMTETSNLLVVEVKAATARPADMAEDLSKLTSLRSSLKDQYGQPAVYRAAYLWIFGLLRADWPALRHNLLGSRDRQFFDPNLILCFAHERAAERALALPWHDRQ